MSFSVGIVGFRGRLGRELVETFEREGYPVVLRRGSGDFRQDHVPDVLIDASSDSGVFESAAYAQDNSVPLIVAVSGLSSGTLADLEDKARQVPIVVAKNLSIGSFLQRKLADALLTENSRIPLGDDVRIEDRHTVAKRDKVSGTAQRLGDLAKRHGYAYRLTVKREGEPVADHTFEISSQEERIGIVHSTRSLKPACVGALRAAEWIIGAPPKLYDIDDVWTSGS